MKIFITIISIICIISLGFNWLNYFLALIASRLLIKIDMPIGFSLTFEEDFKRLRISFWKHLFFCFIILLLMNWCLL